jgi:hypothetical protein
LILTGCPDPNTETKTEYRDKPSVRVANVAFTDGDGTDNAILTFDVILPSGSWDATAVAGFANAGIQADTISEFVITTHDAAQATVDAWDDWSLTAIDTDPKVLKVSLDSGASAPTGISKVSVGIASVSAISALITDSPALTLTTGAATWRYTAGPLVSVTGATLTDGLTATSTPQYTVEFTITGGQWTAAASTAANWTGTITPAFGGTFSFTAAAKTVAVSGAVATVTVPHNAQTISNAGSVTVTVTPFDLTTIAGAGALFDLDKVSAASAKVSLAPGSQGVAGDGKIVGLGTSAAYLVKAGDNWYASQADSTVALLGNDGKLTASNITAAAPAAINGAGSAGKLTSLPAAETYDVYMYGALQSTQLITSNLVNGTKNCVANVAALSTTNTFGIAAGSGVAAANTTIIFVLSGTVAASGHTGTSGAVGAASNVISLGGTIKYTFTAFATPAGAKVWFNAGDEFFTVTGVTDTTAAATITYTTS